MMTHARLRVVLDRMEVRLAYTRSNRSASNTRSAIVPKRRRSGGARRHGTITGE